MSIFNRSRLGNAMTKRPPKLLPGSRLVSLGARGRSTQMGLGGRSPSSHRLSFPPSPSLQNIPHSFSDAPPFASKYALAKCPRIQIRTITDSRSWDGCFNRSHRRNCRCFSPAWEITQVVEQLKRSSETALELIPFVESLQAEHPTYEVLPAEDMAFLQSFPNARAR